MANLSGAASRNCGVAHTGRSHPVPAKCGAVPIQPASHAGIPPAFLKVLYHRFPVNRDRPVLHRLHRHSVVERAPSRVVSTQDSVRATHKSVLLGSHLHCARDMDPPKALSAVIAPEELVYILHHGWADSTVEQKRAAQARIEHAIVCCEPTSTEYAKDVITVWACLHENLRERPRHSCTVSTPDTASVPTLHSAALAVLSGHTKVQQLSFIRHQLCQQRGGALFFATQSAPTKSVKNTHVETLKLLMERFSGDCTFSVTGDWMIDTKTKMVCSAWKTCITDGNEAPFKVAAAEHQERLNDILRPIIKVPIATQLTEVLLVDDSDDAFIVTMALMQELAPGMRVAINGDIFYHVGCKHPVPFYLKNFPVPGLLITTCYGVILGRGLLVFNGRGVYQMVTEWLYLAMITGYTGAEDAANFVFGGGTVSDGNPLLKYAPETRRER